MSDTPMTMPMRYQIPLRPGFDALLVLPRDLQAREVKKLHVFMETLVMPESVEGT